MTTIIDYNDVKKEIVFFLRNNDLFSVSERGVTTTTDASLGTLSAATTVDISSGSVKNIRNVKVAGSTLAYGTDYTYDVDYSSSACRISFVSAQTGACTASYDSGTNDLIWPDLPKKKINISNFPRVGLDIIGDNTEDVDITGDQQIVSLSISIYVYDKDIVNIDDKITSIKTLIIANKKNFHYSRYLQNIGTGGIGLWEQRGENKIFQRNTDFMSNFNEESV